MIFIEKSYFYQLRSNARESVDPYFLGSLKPWKSKETPLGGTLGARSRSEAALEGARSVLERPKVTEGGPQAAQEPTLNHSGSILERFQKVQSVPRIGRAESRSTFAKIDFFRFGDRLFLDVASPEVPQSSSWALSGRSLGPLVALGGPRGIPKGALGPSWGALGRSCVTFEPLKAAKTLQGPN